MKFETAKRKLKKMANGRPYNIKYEQMVHEDGHEVPGCWVYVDGYEHYIGRTWGEALALLEEALKPKRERKVAPKGEVPGAEKVSKGENV